MDSARAGLLTLLAFTLPLGTHTVDSPGFEIRSTVQGVSMFTRVSAEGSVTTQFADSANPKAMTRQFIVRYRDGAVWGVDGEAHQYTRATLAAAFEASGAQQRHVAQSSPPISGGTALARGATIVRLPKQERIGTIPIVGFSVTGAGQEWRIWVAPSLPRIPAKVRTRLAGLVPVAKGSEATLAKLLGYQILRSEVLVGGAWKAVLQTQSITPIQMRAGELEPPDGFREFRPRQSRRDSIGGAPGGYDVPATAVRGPGPEMSNPELYVVLWGNQLNDPAHQGAVSELLAGINDMVRPGYVKPLEQYDIRSASFKGVYHRSDLPPRAVGSSNFAAISAMVYDVGFKDGAPIFWWAVGGHDPLYVLIAANSEVDASGWSGYHFVAFSLTHAVLPFPASLFAHDAIPWAFAKFPDAGLSMPVEGLLHRAECLQFRRDHPAASWPAGIASACAAMNAFDTGTESISHEVVEAASDPYVFLGWSDPGQQPFYEKSELADICEFNPAPFASSSVVGQTSLATYWSNADNACVPESRPTLTVFSPKPGEVLPSAKGNVVLSGYAVDPVDGVISDQIRWEVDGTPLPKPGATMNSGALKAGAHQLRTTIRNTRGLTATSLRGFSVTLPAQTVTITAPVEGGNYPLNHLLVFRGQAFTFQPGDIPDNALRWDDNGTPLGSGSMLIHGLSPAGDHLIRLSAVDAAGTATASAQVTVHVAATGGKINETVVIRQPAANAAVPVDYGKSQSAPITFTAEVLDRNGSPLPSASVIWKSDLDGPLGTGLTITVPLHGGGCAPSTHQITATVSSGGGHVVIRASDHIAVTVGQVC